MIDDNFQLNILNITSDDICLTATESHRWQIDISVCCFVAAETFKAVLLKLPFDINYFVIPCQIIFTVFYNTLYTTLTNNNDDYPRRCIQFP